MDKMNDSISRQTAIAALHGWEQCYTWDESCKDAQNVVSPSKVIEGLAPAKSDSDAEFWENRAAEYSKIIASLVADMASGSNFSQIQITKEGQIIFKKEDPPSGQHWIPVTERIPDEGVDVLVTYDTGGMLTVCIDSCDHYEDTGELFWFASQNVTAWMPLPEPWRGEQDGNK